MPKAVIVTQKYRNLLNACMEVIEAERQIRNITKSETASVIGTPPLSLDQYSRYVNTEHPATPDTDIFFEMCAAVALKPEVVIQKARQRLANTEGG